LSHLQSKLEQAGEENRRNQQQIRELEISLRSNQATMRTLEQTQRKLRDELHQSERREQQLLVKHKVQNERLNQLQQEIKTNEQIWQIEKQHQLAKQGKLKQVMREQLATCLRQTQELQTQHLYLSAQRDIQQREERKLRQQLYELSTKLSAIEQKHRRCTVEKDYINSQNVRIEQRFQSITKAMTHLQIEMAGERARWQRHKQLQEMANKRLHEQNNRLRESRKQLEEALQIHQQWLKYDSREKSGVNKGLARYFQAVVINIKADQIVSYRRFPSTELTELNRPIELSRRTINGLNLLYRGKVEANFSAFVSLEQQLPADLISNLELIYIFVFDDECTRAVTSGLEEEHQRNYRDRRVIWQL
jgi:chromosome segregation ATPase